MNIFAKAKGMIDGYPQREVEIVSGLHYSPYHTFRTITFYSLSQYLGGNLDALGREKPFYNTVNYRLNTAVKATGFDTKDIQLITDDDGDYVRTMLLNRGLHDWFKDTNFARTINQMCYYRPKFGELVVKRVETDEGMHIEVVDWRNFIVDPAQGIDGTTIEIHYFTPEQLYAKRKVWDYVDDVLNEATKNRKDALGSDTTSDDDGIRVIETYGLFRPSALEKDGQEDETEDYKLFKVLLCTEGEYILYKKEVKEKPYKSLAWEEVFGRLGRGVIEDGFEAQVWTNDAIIKERNMMEFASKIYFKTTDDSVEDNALVGLDDGAIIHLADGKDFSQVNTVPSSLPQIQQLVAKWDEQYQRVTSSFDSVTGETMPSRTPFRAAALMAEAGSSYFVQKRQEFGIFMTELVYDWILPHVISIYNKKGLMASDFTGEELKFIDDSFANYKANEYLKNATLQGRYVSPEEFEGAKQAYITRLKQTKSRRFIELPKDYFQGTKSKVDIITTGENVDKAAMFESLNNVFLAYAQNAEAVRADPILSELFKKIVDLSNIGITSSYEQQNSTTLPGQTNAGGAEGVPANVPGPENIGAGLQG